MANKIKLKRGTSTPSTSDITSGEVAIDTSAQKLYINDSGTVKEIGGGGSSIGGDTGVDFNDNVKARWGTGNDLELYHSGSHSFIDRKSGGIGDIYMRLGGDNALVAKTDGSVELHYDGGGNSSFKTTSYGSYTSGQFRINNWSGSHGLWVGRSDADPGAAVGVQISCDSTKSFIKSYGANLRFQIAAVDGTASNALIIDQSTKDADFYGDINVLDNKKLLVGTGDDLQIYHDGSNSYIDDTGTGGLKIRVAGTSDNGFYKYSSEENIARFIPDGSVDLYYDNSKKFETLSWGAKVTGALQTTSHVDLAADNAYVKIGASADLNLYHNGTHSYIADLGTGDLRITGSAVHIQNAAQGENMLQTFEDGAVELYYDNSKKLQTTSSSVRVIGNLQLDGDNRTIKIGASEDLQLYHDGSNSYITNSNTSGHLYIRAGNNIYFQTDDGNQTAIQINEDLGVQLYFNTSKKLETTSSGADLTGTFVATSNIKCSADNGKFISGASDDLQLYHDGTNSTIYNSTGLLNLQNDGDDINLYAADDITLFVQGTEPAIKCIGNGAVELYYNNEKVFYTKGDGAQVQNTNGDGVLYVVGSEGNEALVKLFADDGDDNADKFQLVSHADNYFAVQNYASGSWEQNIKATGNGSVELYYDNSKKVETSANGLDFGDVVKASFGDGGDLTIYHNGTNSYLDNGTGDLYLRPQSDIYWKNLTSNDVYLKGINNGAVEIYYDGNKKAETVTGGFTVTGTCTATAFAGDGSSLTGISASDSTKLPLAGGTMTGNLLFGDGIEARFGASADLKLWHGSGHSWIKNITGSLYVAADAFRVSYADMTGTMITADNGGKVALYYDNSKKFETTSTGAKVKYALQIEEESGSEYYQFVTNSYGGLEVQNETTKVCEFTDASTLDFPDNNKIQLGTGSDLQIFHNNSHSFLRNATGNLYLGGADGHDGNIVIQATYGEESIWAKHNGAVELYYDNSKKLETTSEGVQSSGHIRIIDEKELKVGSGNDLRLFHLSNHSYIDNYTGDLRLRSGNIQLTKTDDELHVNCVGDGAVQLYYDNVLRFGTNSDGAQVFGNLYHADNSKDYYGDSNDLQIYHDGSNSHVRHTGTGDLYIEGGAGNAADVRIDAQTHIYMHVNGNESCFFAQQNAHVSLYYDGSQKFYTQSDKCVVAGHFYPESTNSYDLGHPSYRWRNLYVEDMHFSNESKDKGNDIDGTWGDWTLQEGDENIFMINNRTGKKYKMALQEVV